MSTRGPSMQALVIAKPNNFAVESVAMPSPGPNEVLCRVRAVSICGTDSHLVHGDYPGFWPPGFPFTSGHEWAGEVVEAGPGVDASGFPPGTRVAGTFRTTSHDISNLQASYTPSLHNH